MEKKENSPCNTGIQGDEYYKQILSIIPESIVVYSDYGKVVFANQAFQMLYGWSLSELLGRKIDFIPEEELKKSQRGIDQMIQGEDIMFETQRLTKDGKTP